MPTIPEALAIAIQHHQNGRLAVAEQLYQEILKVDPNHVDALQLLGVVAGQMEKYALAVQHMERAIALKPTVVDFHMNLGRAYKNWRKTAQAVDSYRQAIKLNPDSPETQNDLGNAMAELGQVEEATACYRRALKFKPNYAAALNNLGYNLRNQGKIDEAIDCYRQAIELSPERAEIFNNLGIALRDQGYLNEAAASYRRALELQPDFAEAHYNLGTVLKTNGNLEEAAAYYRRALRLQPDMTPALSSLIHTLLPLCAWDDVTSLSRSLIALVDGDQYLASPVAPFGYLALPTVTTAEQQQRCARKWVKQELKYDGATTPQLTRGRLPATKAKLTIGYLSADYRYHPVAWLIAELFEKHDRERFSVFGYSYGANDDSPIRKRIANAFDRFVDITNLSYEKSAHRIFADKVDILVDLTGYTQYARTKILTLRPAPIQVNYLGYPGTMGAPFLDYIVVDPFVVPSDQQPLFDEQLVQLPHCYQVNDSQRNIAADTPTRAECGLPAEGFVFCSFNNNYKITPDMFDVWMRILKAVPQSVLWLFEGNSFAAANLRKEADRRGVAAERLIFAPRKLLPEHLARHRLADLFLDTFPYTAHTTASDALWAGCPVLTLAGETFASRVAGSLLHTIGLPELVTTSVQDYQAMAIRLAQDPKLLTELRTRLATNRATTPLFDAGKFARHLEAAYQTMWEIYRSGEQPRPITVA